MNRSEAKVSIILPIYNMEPYLTAAIDSVLAQTHKNWELIIIDNCSTDASASIARRFAESDPRIIFSQNRSNLGPLINHNLCIEKTTGDYIELFGGDDIFEPSCLEKLANYLDNNQAAAMVTSARRHINEQGQTIEEIRPADSTQLIASKQAIKSNLVDFTNWIVTPVMFRAKHKQEGFDDSLVLYADIDYWIQILRNGDLGYIDEILFNYRVHLASGTIRLLRELNFIPDILRMAKKHASTFTDNDILVDELERIVAKKFTDIQDHATRNRGVTFKFDEDASVFIDKNDDRSPKEIAKELADFKKAVYVCLNYSNSLRTQIETERHEHSNIVLQHSDKLAAQKAGRKADVDAYEAQSQKFKSGMRELEGRISTFTQQTTQLLNENKRLTDQCKSLAERAEFAERELTSAKKTLTWRLASVLSKLKARARFAQINDAPILPFQGTGEE